MLSLVLTGLAQAELLAHWKFDEGSGNTLVDSSGNGHHGVISGTPQWGPGMAGLALDNRTTTTGTRVPSFDITGGTGSCTLAFWTNWDGFDETQHILTKSNGWDDTHMLQVEIKGRATETADRKDCLIWVHRGDTQYPLHQVPVDEWAHHTLAYNGDNRTITSYLNGELAVESPSGMGRDIDSPVLIGMAIESARLYRGWLDDMWLFSGVLSRSQVAALMAGGLAPGLATNPNPADEASQVPCDSLLSWTAGQFAATHNVYLGTRFQDVNEASVATPLGVLARAGHDTTTFDPGPLEFGQTYYWRVDEVNRPPDNTIYQGAVWSFTVEPYAYPVQPVAATASSGAPGMGPEKTIDGSGLTGDLHGTDPTSMWLSSGGKPHWIRYEFDKVYKLHELHVWNSNQIVETFVGFGARQVTVETSADGTIWAPVADVPEFSRGPGATSYAANTTVSLKGIEAKFVKLTIETTWAGTAPQTGLAEVRFFHVPLQARDPQPADAATNVPLDASLDWRPGREATSHTVYFGTEAAAVAAGTVAAQTVATHGFVPEPMNLGTTYYWRVDEVGTATVPGPVWSFTTQDFLVVDDFESYTDAEGNRIYEIWVDGLTDAALGGSQVGYNEAPFAERVQVHGGKASMPLAYNNTTAPLSEATRTLAPAQDWTVSGIKTLVLFFYGDPANTGAGLYIKINGTKIPYNGDAANLQKSTWSQWNIDLSALPAATRRSVRTLTIGMTSGTGKLLLDDIGLYAVPPVTP